MTSRKKKGAAAGRPADPVGPLPNIAEFLTAVANGMGLDLNKSVRQKLRRLHLWQGADFAADERQIVGAIDAEVDRLAGKDWAELFRGIADAFSTGLQLIARTHDCTLMLPGKARAAFRGPLAQCMPVLLEGAPSDFGGPDAALMLKQPFAAWVSWAESQLRFSADLKHIEPGDRLRVLLQGGPERAHGSREKLSDKSWRRWLHGGPIEVLRPQTLHTALAGQKDVRANVVGWFLIARLLQNTRPYWGVDMGTDPQNGADPRSLEMGLLRAQVSLSDREAQLLDYRMRLVENLIERESVDRPECEFELLRLRRHIKSLPFPASGSLLHLHHWMRALLETRTGHDVEARKWFRRALALAWWRAGSYQENILKDSLLHAVLTGDAVEAKDLWQRSFFLGLNDYPRPQLASHDLSRLAMAAEKRFCRRAVRRVTSAPAVFLTSDTQRILDEALRGARKLEQMTKIDDGRVRRTPLMIAVMIGTADQVRTLIEMGADICRVVPESGCTALSIALEDAARTSDLSKVSVLLEVLPPRRGEYTRTDWNRPTGAERIWPLALAIDLRLPWVVERLLELGASSEAPCKDDWPPLYYSLLRIAWGRHGAFNSHFGRWLDGDGYPTAWDARLGAVHRSELSRVRTRHFTAAMRDPRGRAIWGNLRQLVGRPDTPKQREGLREIVRLVVRSAGSRSARLVNEYVRVGPGSQERWTAVHLAAELGDPAIMQILIDAGGKPELPLRDISGRRMEGWDAHKIAATYQQDEIVGLLKARGRPRAI